MPHDLDHHGIGGRLRASRERVGLSREELAVRAGISWSAIAQVESGRRSNLRPSTLAALTQALDVTIDYLVSGRALSTPMLEHRAVLYETEADLFAMAVPFLQDARERSEPVLVITNQNRNRRLRRQLGAQAKEVTFASCNSLYSTPAGALRSCRRFVDESLDRGAPWVRIIGEPVWSGRSTDDVRMWTRYESLLNLALSGAPVTVHCLYNSAELDPQIVEHALETHPQTIKRDRTSPNEGYLDPGGFMLAE